MIIVSNTLYICLISVSLLVNECFWREDKSSWFWCVSYHLHLSCASSGGFGSSHWTVGSVWQVCVCVCVCVRERVSEAAMLMPNHLLPVSRLYFPASVPLFGFITECLNTSSFSFLIHISHVVNRQWAEWRCLFSAHVEEQTLQDALCAPLYHCWWEWSEHVSTARLPRHPPSSPSC